MQPVDLRPYFAALDRSADDYDIRRALLGMMLRKNDFSVVNVAVFFRIAPELAAEMLNERVLH